MAYRVIRQFKDKETQKTLKVGDEYVRTGKGKNARIERLLSSNNGAGQPVIEEVKEAEEEGDS